MSCGTHFIADGLCMGAKLLMIDESIFDEAYKTVYFLPFLSNQRAKRTREEYRRQLLQVTDYFYEKKGTYAFYDLDLSDAKEYFLVYLSELCRSGQLGYDTFRLRLSVCRSFNRFIREKQTAEGDLPMELIFEKIVGPEGPLPVREDRILAVSDIDTILARAKTFDSRLYVIFLLSFRMGLKQTEILRLDGEHFHFFSEGKRLIGVLTLFRQKEGVCRLKVPADLSSYLFAYTQQFRGPLFTNRYGNRLNATNLTRLMCEFCEQTGVTFTIGQLRSRGLIDLVASNQNDLTAVEDYTGLSRQMVEAYGAALDLTKDCVADHCRFQILTDRQERSPL